MKVSKVVRLFAYYIIPLFAFLFEMYRVFAGESIYYFVVLYAQFAYALVAVIVFVRPLHTLTRLSVFSVLLRYRREMGVLAFWFVMMHGISLLITLDVFGENVGLLLDPTNALFYGGLAFIGMVLLGLTSNRLSVIRLGTYWKVLHMVVYPTFVFISIHKYLHTGETFALWLLGAYVVVRVSSEVVDRKRREAMREGSGE